MNAPILLRIFLVAVVIFCGITLASAAVDVAQRIGARGIVASAS